MFVLPTFNLEVGFWWADGGVFPPGPPSGVTLGNLAWGRRVNPSQALAGFGSLDAAVMTLLVPAATDIRSPVCYGFGGQHDVVEVPLGSGRFYQVTAVDDMGKGFANEHRACILAQTAQFGAWPIPMP